MTQFDWSTVPTEQHLKVLDALGDDGHTIWGVSHLAEAGIDSRIIQAFVHTYQSDLSSPKSTIHVNDVPVASLSGVYGLAVLHSLARYHGVTTDKLGRGRQATDLTHKLRALLRT